MSLPSFNLEPGDLEGLSRHGSHAVLCAEILADLLTPLGAFLHVADLGGHAFLLESVEGGESVARYSFLGSGARRVYRVRNGRLTVQERSAPERELEGHPLEAFRRARRRVRPAPQEGLPPFAGGLVGFFGYDFVRCLERLPARTQDDLGVPEAVLAEYDTVLAFDHSRNRLLLMARIALDAEASVRAAAHDAARQRLESLAARLAAPVAAPLISWAQAERPQPPDVEPDDSGFLQAVARAKDAIAAGEIFQVVLSRRFSRPWRGSPVAVYRLLRSQNPSPYHFLLACDGDFLVGASPEMLVRVQDGDVAVRPIAGTRPRGRDAAADAALESELRGDEKERAEHVMLVDLARNDIGRVCLPGTVRVERFAEVERYSHVMHLVSRVRGKLAPERDALDALAACFPAGTLSGAPKVRAMQIIEETERFRRGPYGGAVAYWDDAGRLDACIAIRTVVLSGGRAHVQAGAGIVADSDPQAELREVQHKAQAALQALAAAEAR